MPIYEYQCQSCQHELEVLQKISDAPLTDCPACGQPSLRKKISAAGFRLAGSGWYETDFKKSGNKKNLAGEGSDSKPDTKTDASAKSDGAKSSETKSTSTKSAGTSSAASSD